MVCWEGKLAGAAVLAGAAYWVGRRMWSESSAALGEADAARFEDETEEFHAQAPQTPHGSSWGWRVLSKRNSFNAAAGSQWCSQVLLVRHGDREVALQPIVATPRQ